MEHHGTYFDVWLCRLLRGGRWSNQHFAGFIVTWNGDMFHGIEVYGMLRAMPFLAVWVDQSFNFQDQLGSSISSPVHTKHSPETIFY